MTDPNRGDSPHDRPIESEIESRATVAVRVSDIDKLADDDRPPGFIRRLIGDPFILVGLLVVLSIAAIFVVPRVLWRLAPSPSARVVLVDYTVPFVSAREHRGAAWVLNHEKYVGPDRRPWSAVGTHVGYDPLHRDVQTTIAQQDLREVDWLFVTDAYGVYEDDLLDIEHEIAHLDRSKKVFGGISDADAAAISAFSARGGHTFLEFNSLEQPTEPAARAVLEQLFGVHWTGWSGRTFFSLSDTLDVPRWFPRVFRQHFGDRPLPSRPTLVLVHSDGRMLLITDSTLSGAGPRVHVTEAGVRELPRALGGAEYPFWFPVLTVRDSSTELLAELVLPTSPALGDLLAREGLPRDRIPLLTRRITTNGAHHVYLAADMSDTDFHPGRYDLLGPEWMRGLADLQPDLIAGAHAFWDFYVPAVSALLKSPR